MIRPWAFWRRVEYGTGFGVFWILVFSFIYVQYFYAAPTCFDESQNGEERGVDCGGSCIRMCSFEVTKPTVAWARSFRVSDGQYNAVAYLDNKNKIAASPEVAYTFSLYDEQGLITERSGTTILPPDSSYPIFESRIDTGGRVPLQTFLEIGPIDLWLPAEAAVQQFTVTDRKLTGVDASPRLDAKLYNNSLTAADRVEVVATIFDRDGNALNASRTFVDNFDGRTEETVVFTWPEPIAKTLKSCEVPTDIVLALDVSGSMNNDSDNPPEPITSVKKAAESFVNRLGKNDQVSLVTFASDAVVASELTLAKSNVGAEIAALAIAPVEETGNTNTGDALLRAHEELTSIRHSVEARKVLVLLTDGLATAPEEEPEAYAVEAAGQVKASGIDIYAIGLGEQVNMDFVRSLATNELQAYRALGTADVNRIYETITSAICEEGPAVIQIVPKTKAAFSTLQ